MTTGQPTAIIEGQSSATGGEAFGDAYREMRSNGDIQFAEVPMPEAPEAPDWLTRFMEWLADALGPVGSGLVSAWPVLKWMLVAIGVALAAYLVWQLVAPILGVERRRKVAQDEEWVPDETEALALLEEADRLAAQGQYDEATHLLLKRSVGQIRDARPDLVEPSSTARELSAEPSLPEKARNAFAVIAGRVERSLFALVPLAQEDWQAARAAYADFALQQKALAA